MPLFGVYYTEDDGRKRRIFSGVIPVGKRETYMGATFLPAAGGTTASTETTEPPDPRMFAAWTDVTEPWKRLLETADAAKKAQEDPDGEASASELEAQIKAAREQVQTGSWYILLDFVKYLEENIRSVWSKLNGEEPEEEFTTEQGILLEALQDTTIGSELEDALVNSHYSKADIKDTLADALVAIRNGDIEERLEKVVARYDRDDPDAPLDELQSADSQVAWPEFLFPLADTEYTAPLPPPADAGSEDEDSLQAALDRIDNLSNLIQAALPELSAPSTVEAPLASKLPLDTRDGWFVIRCVFERLRCGPLDPPVVSEPTSPFRLAGFFDPDAPARPIRVALPVDTSAAGLRKFNKNTAFMISDMLCGQIDRVKALGFGDLVRSVLPWPFHKDLSVPDKGPCTVKNDPSLQAGMICSFSIPIITICALIVLIIMVSLLDFVFRWLPYFFICFPLPGFKAKR